MTDKKYRSKRIDNGQWIYATVHMIDAEKRHVKYSLKFTEVRKFSDGKWEAVVPAPTPVRKLKFNVKIED